LSVFLLPKLVPVIVRRVPPIVITLDPLFPYPLKKDEFSVNATSTDIEGYVRYLYVLSVDDGAKTIKAMFGGARSGAF
jgi:hypothetical protein